MATATKAIDSSGYSSRAQKVLILGKDNLTPASSSNALEVKGSIVVTSNTTEALQYLAHDIEETGNITYIGKEKNNGDWLFMKMDESSGTEMRFANVSNNVSYTSYSSAWTNRATLTYDIIENLTGV